MQSLRERIKEKKEDLPSVLLAFDDFIPLLGAVSLFPIVINASAYVPLAQAGIIQAVGITIATFTGTILFIIAASSIQTAEYGRYISLLLISPVLVMTVAGLQTWSFNTIGVGFAAISAVLVDVMEET